jgi:lauroyl/myristoyl acyltransferase
MTPRPLVGALDIYEVPRLALQGLLAWTLPEAVWWPLTRVLGRLNVTMHPARTRRQTARIRALLSGNAARDSYGVAVEIWANRYEERFQYLRAWRPGGWTPNIGVAGAQHVSAAFQRGHGIIFWGGNFSFNALVAKMAMHRLGLKVSGFAVPRHGFSDTRFGVRYLNRVCRDIEDRYLGERLMEEPHAFPVALRRMSQRLEANGAVYFAVGGRGRRTATARFLGSSIIIATGPVAMAHATGAALLPLHTFRNAPGRFEVTIGPPIEIREDINGYVDCAAAVQAYVDKLIPFVLRDPGQWRGWQLLDPLEPWGGKYRS